MQEQMFEEPNELQAMTELDDQVLLSVSGGYPCSYLGVEDWRKMMSYETRNYCC